MTGELQREQVESATRPCTTLAEVDRELRRARSVAAQAALAAGSRRRRWAPPRWPSSRRCRERAYREMGRRFGADGVRGAHLRVPRARRGRLRRGGCRRARPDPAVARAPARADRELALLAGRRLRVRELPHPGGSRWHVGGTYAPFGSPAVYHDTVQAMIDTETLLDRGMVYFDARLSVQHPTLEVRVGDVCLDVDDAVLLAALVRGLVETAAGPGGQGAPADPVRLELLRLAAWRAARSGVDEMLLDPCTWRPAPAADVLGRLVTHVTPALEDAGDLTRCASGSLRYCAAARGRGRSAGRRTRRRRWSWPYAGPQRTWAELCLAGPFAHLADREPDQPDDDEPEHHVAHRAEPTLHAVPVVAEDPAQRDEDRVPDAAADRREQQETGHRHAVDAGGDRDDAADQRDAAAEQHHLAAVPGEDLLTAVEVLLARDEEPALARERVEPVVAEPGADP